MSRRPNTVRNAEIIRRRDAGEQPAQIARAMGLTRNVVLGVLFRAGKCAPGGAENGATPEFKRLVAAALSRMTWREVCDAYGVSVASISRWKKQVGRAA